MVDEESTYNITTLFPFLDVTLSTPLGAVCFLRSKYKQMDPSYQQPMPCDKGPDELYDFHLNFQVLGALLLLSPLIYDICQIIINTYHRVRAESIRTDLELAESTPDKASLAEAYEGEVVSTAKGWGFELKDGWAERSVGKKTSAPIKSTACDCCDSLSTTHY